VRGFSLLVQFHLGLGCLSAPSLPLLRHVTLLVGHPVSSGSFADTIVAEKPEDANEDARLDCEFVADFG